MILNFNFEALKVDEQVEKEMQRLCENASLQLSYAPLDTISPLSHFKTAFNNCRSLHLHFEDIRYDQNLLSCHVIGLAETRLHHVDNSSDYQLDGFKLIRNDQKTNRTCYRPAHGLAIYVSNDVHVTSEISYSTKQLEFTLLKTRHSLTEMQIVVLYKSPTMVDSDFSVSGMRYSLIIASTNRAISHVTVIATST